VTITPTDTKPPVLTLQERLLLAEISQHLRESGWLRPEEPQRLRDVGWPGAPGWRWCPDKNLAVEWRLPSHADPGEIRVLGDLVCTAQVGTVAQAVDVAVAMGVLPPPFCSAYGSGVEWGQDLVDGYALEGEGYIREADEEER